jgi:hypothetical protein
MSMEIVICSNCGSQFSKDDLQRSCGNCFACLSCEIYICPNCGVEIVIRPMRKKGEIHDKGNSK